MGACDILDQRKEIMLIITLIALLAFVAQAYANEVAANVTVNDMDDVQADQLVDQVLNKLASKLIDRVLAASAVHDEGMVRMDTTTLGKPAHNIGVPAHANPSDPSSHLAPSSPDTEEVIIIEEEPEDGDALPYVLSLHGGATPMKAKKSPMKAAMKSPMKAMKGMNEYFTKMTEARKTGAKSFEYNGKTYVATKAKTGMVLYKAK